ncbi:MAG: SDR family oxidoreductase [Actinomycetia bacterium]|nr:SDR family oxidoreductase [Actinomycetes bacterium]
MSEYQRLAIVTGGARGLGLAMVHALLDQDVVDRVVVFDLIDDPIDDERITVQRCDVTDTDSVGAAYAAVGEVPQVLVNNAGGDPGSGVGALDHGPFEDPDQFRRMLELNFTTAHVVTSVIGPDLTDGAAICCTASIAGQMASPLFAYGAAKSAMIHWTKSMARVLGPRGIRINAVAPGIIRTFLWEQMEPDIDRYKRNVVSRIPLLSDQTPEDIADAVAFLCSKRARSITGQTLAIDGGMTAGEPIYGSWESATGRAWSSAPTQE